MASLVSLPLNHVAVASCNCSAPCLTSSFLRPALPPMRASRLYAQLPPTSELDTAAFEADRLRQDAQARVDAMRLADEASTANEDDPAAWKWAIRKRVWDLMEHENIAQHPRPVHHRIPNFAGAAAAAKKVASLPAFQAAKCVKVNPDRPQKEVRYITLQGNKKLLTPQPRLRTGFFSELEAASLSPDVIREACTAVGVAKYGKPLGIDSKLKVDLIVIGSVAVDSKTGARLGKGEGFAELEYAILQYMGAIDDSTLVVTTVHDKQLVDDIPVKKLQIHDVPVDIICTPTSIIFTNTTIPKPQGIYWELLSPEKLSQIAVLQELKKKIEAETGQALPTGPSEKLPPVAKRAPMRQRVEGAISGSTIFLWNLDIGTTWKELQEHVSNAGSEPLRVEIFRKDSTSRPTARILLREGADVDTLVKTLKGSKLRNSTIRGKINSTETTENPSSEKGPATENPVMQHSESTTAIFVWNLDFSTSWKELHEHVVNVGFEPLKVNLFRKDSNSKPMARVTFKGETDTESVIKAVDGSKLKKSTIRAKIATSKRLSRQANL